MMSFTGHFPYSDMAIAIICRSVKYPSGVLLVEPVPSLEQVQHMMIHSGNLQTLPVQWRKTHLFHCCELLRRVMKNQQQVGRLSSGKHHSFIFRLARATEHGVNQELVSNHTPMMPPCPNPQLKLGSTAIGALWDQLELCLGPSPAWPSNQPLIGGSK